MNKLGDRWWIYALIAVNLSLVGLAVRYYRSLNEIALQDLGRPPVTEEELALRELEKIAQTGSWEAFENARAEHALHFLRINARPGRAASVYFFPETLPPHSLEKEFAIHELQPSIDALKQAYLTHEERSQVAAYRTLKSRVENYELGATQNRNELSPEAQHFLKTYHTFTESRKLGSE